MSTKASDAEMFSALTQDEVHVLVDKLMSGACTAWRGTGDGDTHDFISSVISDVQANYTHRRALAAVASL